MLGTDRAQRYADKRKRRARSGAFFSPLMVPEVTSGYFWDPSSATGSAGAGFLLPEGNGDVNFDLITPAANTAPTIASLNSQAIVTYANGSPDRITRTFDNVQRGFTGAAMLAGWFNCASAAGIVFSHGRGNFRFAIQLVAATVRVYVDDGVTIKENHFPIPPGGYAAAPFYYEGLFVPSEVTATNRIQLTIDRVAQVPTFTTSPGTSMSDVTDEVGGGVGTTSDSSTSNISADFSHGMVYLTNGIPSDGNRDRLFGYRRLK